MHTLETRRSAYKGYRFYCNVDSIRADFVAAMMLLISVRNVLYCERRLPCPALRSTDQSSLHFLLDVLSRSGTMAAAPHDDFISNTIIEAFNYRTPSIRTSSDTSHEQLAKAFGAWSDNSEHDGNDFWQH